MRTPVFSFFLPGIVAALLASATPGRSEDTPPPLQKIVDRTVARDDFRLKELQSMQYDQTANLDELDSNGNVTKHETLEMIIRPGGKPEMKIVSVKGDHIPSNPDEAENQAKGRDVEDNKHSFNLRTLVDRFSLAYAGRETLGGHPAYVIAFTPKPDQPYHDETEKIVNQLHGKIWVSTDSYDVLQTEASLTEPVYVAWFLASIPKLTFHYSRLDLSKEFTSCQVQIALEIKALFVDIRQRQILDIRNFRPRN